MLIENSRRGAATFDFSTWLGITFPSTEKAVLAGKAVLLKKKNPSKHHLCLADDKEIFILIYFYRKFMSYLLPFNRTKA